MTPEQLKYIRKRYGTGDLMAFCTSGVRVNGRLDGVHIIWDDNNALMHVVSTNEQYEVYQTTPFLIKSYEYDDISVLASNATPEYLRSWLDELEKDGIIDAGKKQEILKDMAKYAPENNMYIKPEDIGSMTNPK